MDDRDVKEIMAWLEKTANLVEAKAKEKGDTEVLRELEDLRGDMDRNRRQLELPNVRERVLEHLYKTGGATEAELKSILSEGAFVVHDLLESYMNRDVLRMEGDKFVLDPWTDNTADMTCKYCGATMNWSGFGSMSTSHSNFYKCSRCEHEAEVYDSEMRHTA